MRNAQDILQHTNQHPADLFVEPVCIPAYRSTQRSSSLTQHSNTSAALQQHSSNSIQPYSNPAALTLHSNTSAALQQHSSNSIQFHSDPAASAAYKYPNTQQQTTLQYASQHTNQRPTALRSPQHQQLNSFTRTQYSTIQQPHAVLQRSNALQHIATHLSSISGIQYLAALAANHYPITQQHRSTQHPTTQQCSLSTHINTQRFSSTSSIQIQQPCAVPSTSNSTASRVPNIQQPNSFAQYSSVATRPSSISSTYYLTT
jgi:hypothetical protein